MYHAVDDISWGLSELFVRPANFEAQMRYLADNGYTPILFGELENSGSYEKPVIITFDDGYEDNYRNAYPVLKKYGFKAVVFLIVNNLDTPHYLTKAQIVEMKDMISFQSHTLNHPELSKISREELESECVMSKSVIEALTGEPVNVISYPYGLYNGAVINVVSRSYNYAVTTKTGVYGGTDDNYRICRIRVGRSDTLSSFAAKIDTARYGE